MDPLVLDLAPLVDDREDEEAEDDDGEAELQRQPHALAARWAGADLGPSLSDAVQKWLALRHERLTLDNGGMGEFELLARIRERLPPAGPRVRVGMGDDAAVTVPGGATATSVDAIVDGVHFRREPLRSGPDRPQGPRHGALRPGGDGGGGWRGLRRARRPPRDERGRVHRAARRDRGAGGADRNGSGRRRRDPRPGAHARDDRGRPRGDSRGVRHPRRRAAGGRPCPHRGDRAAPRRACSCSSSPSWPLP